MALNNNKQSNLEIKGREERNKEISHSHYDKNRFYSESHEDAISNPSDTNKPLGKGTGNGGHQNYKPNSNMPSTGYYYDSLNTSEGGGSYDIYGKDGKSGRERLTNFNIYNKSNSYGPNSIDTSLNIEEGQYSLK